MRNAAITATGGAAGWFATVTAHDVAATLAALATAAWMISQTVVLLRRHRCTRILCKNRLP